ncbi:MAG TPA: hypothetical protein VES67_00350, partial [Vicinamibacterales bacterium]|nr:hypothetical protein [Vicinamibacterales bacterium]
SATATWPDVGGVGAPVSAQLLGNESPRRPRRGSSPGVNTEDRPQREGTDWAGGKRFLVLRGAAVKAAVRTCGSERSDELRAPLGN